MKFRDSPLRGYWALAALVPVAAGLILLTFLYPWAPSEYPRSIRVGVLPDQSAEKLAARYTLLLAHLVRETGLPFELVIPADYDELLQMFYAKNIDLAYFGGLTFLKAHERSGAVPLAMRDVDARFRSYFLVNATEPATSIAEMRGGTLAFGSRLSTSGHLMPRYFMVESGIDPEGHFGEIVYSGSHDATAMLVRDGEADLGAANGEIIERMFSENRLNRNEIRILWKTPPYPDYVWAIRKEIDGSVRRNIQDAFIALSPGIADHSKVLLVLGAQGFLPASVNDFAPLRTIAESQGLID